MARKSRSGDYAVGYKKPPTEHQFKPGIGGGGRKPKKSRTAPINLADNFGLQVMDELFTSEAYRLIPLVEKGKTIRLPMIQAIMRSLYVQAVKGERHAQRLVVERLGAIETAQSKLVNSLNDELIAYKIGWKRFIVDELAAGRPEPVLVPHPDDILMDPVTGKMRVYGPKTEEKRHRLDRLIANLDDFQQEVDDSRSEWEKAVNEDEKAFWRNEWHISQKSFDCINDNIPPRHRRVLHGRSKAEGSSQPGDQARIDFPQDFAVNPRFAIKPDGLAKMPIVDPGSTRRRRP